MVPTALRQMSSSGVSLRVPDLNDDGDQKNHLLSIPRRPSMVSVASTAWGSFRLSLHNVSRAAMRVFLFAPCSRHRCCIGCISLHDAISLICVAELIVLGLCSMIAIDFYVKDGKMFYTKEMEGQGTTIVIAFSVFSAISVPVIAMTLVAWHLRKPHLYIIHILWQWSVLQVFLFYAYSILRRTFSPDLRSRTGFLLPSAIVLSIVAILLVAVQSWWLFIFVDAMFYELRGRWRRILNPSTTTKDGEVVYFNTQCSLESRRPSLVIPVVKVDRAMSVESTTLEVPGSHGLTKLAEIPEFDNAVDV